MSGLEKRWIEAGRPSFAIWLESEYYRLEAENERLRAALQDLSKAAQWFLDMPKDDDLAIDMAERELRAILAAVESGQSKPDVTD